MNSSQPCLKMQGHTQKEINKLEYGTECTDKLYGNIVILYLNQSLAYPLNGFPYKPRGNKSKCQNSSKENK